MTMAFQPCSVEIARSSRNGPLRHEVPEVPSHTFLTARANSDILRAAIFEATGIIVVVLGAPAVPLAGASPRSAADAWRGHEGSPNLSG